jgi:hypothetical protein
MYVVEENKDTEIEIDTQEQLHIHKAQLAQNCLNEDFDSAKRPFSLQQTLPTPLINMCFV